MANNALNKANFFSDMKKFMPLLKNLVSKDFKIKYIPTMSTLDTMIFEFPHKGKISKD